jgi:hypothetical protein
MSGGSGAGTPQVRGTVSASASAAATAKQQADAIYLVINESGQLRSDANNSVSDVNGCRNLPAAQSLLQTTGQKRQSQADQVAKLDVSKIPNGVQLVAALKQAWTSSAQSDAAYASIAADLGSNCKPASVRKDPNYAAADAGGRSASSAKSAAAQLWNADADSLGQTQISESKL